MCAFQPPKVLIVASSDASGRRFRDALAGVAEIVSQPEGEDRSATDLPFDVMLTDCLAEVAWHCTELSVRVADENRDLKKPTIRIGLATEGWADLTLAEDWTPRELRLACTLLGEISRLRAQGDQVARAGHEIRQMAYTDPLTALANRRAWDTQLEARCGHAATAPFWLAIVDLDRFKQINDRCGLAVGDCVLKQVAERLAHSVRREDLVARLGGDEFGVLLGGIDEAVARSVLDRLRKAVADLAAGEEIGPLTVSVGYARASARGAHGAELLAAAERGLRRAKQAGGDSIFPGDDPND